MLTQRFVLCKGRQDYHYYYWTAASEEVPWTADVGRKTARSFEDFDRDSCLAEGETVDGRRRLLGSGAAQSQKGAPQKLVDVDRTASG